jgi:hypothetical protein
MTDIGDDLIRRLEAFGEELSFDDTELVNAVLARLDEPSPKSARQWWIAAAAVFVVVLAGVLVYPDSRHAVARWFGLEHVEVEVDPDLSLAPPPTSFALPGPGESEVVVIDGRQILVSTIVGGLNETLIGKAASSYSQIQPVTVNGSPGLWISGGSHEVRYEIPEDGGIAVERVAANTLLWESEGVLRRVEGFDELADALEFAEGT